MKKLFCCVLCVLLLPLYATAGSVLPANAPQTRPTVEGLDADGYLSHPGEYVLEDAANGFWYYVSDTLRVEIDRYTATSVKEVYYIANIYQKNAEGLSTFLSNEKKPFDEFRYVDDLARREHLVFATNGDFFADRTDAASGPVGVVVRHKTIIANKTKKNVDSLPSRDVIALFPDGGMKCFDALAYTAQDYIEMGATDVLCFGPMLVTNGRINMAELQSRTPGLNPRCSIGMVVPGHYVFILCEGRSDTSEGVTLITLAELMYEAGCTEALNLDGGQTAVMCFMGKKINSTGSTGRTSSARKITDIIGTGVSELVH